MLYNKFYNEKKIINYLWRRGFGPTSSPAFTLIEVLCVTVFLSILAMSMIQGFEYSVKKEKEERLKGTLNSIRNAIDRYYFDRLAEAPPVRHEKRFPFSLDELVEKKYLRAVPCDPISGKAEWELLYAEPAGGLFDVRSKARGAALDGSLYSLW